MAINTFPVLHSIHRLVFLKLQYCVFYEVQVYLNKYGTSISFFKRFVFILPTHVNNVSIKSCENYKKYKRSRIINS